MSDPTQSGPTSVTMDDIQRELDAGAAAAADVTQVKLDGDGVPENLRGKSVKDIMTQLENVQQSLKLSEAARLEAANRPAPAPAPVAAPVEEPEVTDEQIAQLFQEDQLRAIQVMNDRAERRMNKNLELRLAPLAQGTAAQVEQSIRAKYAEEFELFGPEIVDVASKIPNARQVLTNPEAWENVISYVRGKSGNIDKIFERRAAKLGAPTRETARQEQAAGVGFSDHSGGRGRGPTSAAGLDPIQLEIAGKMNMTPEEYIKWSKIS